jgi:hypothetical protein
MFVGLKPTYRKQSEVLDRISQEQVFSEYLGIYPDLTKRYLSPFRQDKDPGCRFTWHHGILYFVENTMFQNKLYWSCIDVVMYVKQCNYQEALNLLWQSGTNSKKVTKVQVNTFVPEIRFEKKQWGKNLFMLSGEVLEKELVFCVKNYWIKTKSGWQKNSIHHPDVELTIAYYFPDTNHVKLYFPYAKENRWYSTCTTQDIFGSHKLKYYQSKSEILYITKSAKDRLMLDYFIGVSAIALQNEGCYLPEDIALDLSVMFKEVIFLYDNDIPGITHAQKLSEKYNFKYKVIDVLPKDTFEMIDKFGVDNTKKLIL